MKNEKPEEIFILAVAGAREYIKKFPCNERNTSLGCYDMHASDDYPPLEAAILAGSFGQFESAVEKSKTDQNIFIGIKLQLANSLESEEEIPLPYRQWLISFLRDEIKEPLKRRGRTSRREDVCVLVYDVIQRLNMRGLTIYRNIATTNIRCKDHKDNKYYSSADVVAEAMRLERREPSSYEAVIKYYKEGKKITHEIAQDHPNL